MYNVGNKTFFLKLFIIKFSLNEEIKLQIISETFKNKQNSNILKKFIYC